MKTLKIAICDDEKNIRSYLRKLVEGQRGKYEVKEYASARELISYVKNNSGSYFDIILLDIAMSDTDGIEAAETLRKFQDVKGISAWGNLPLIIFVTGLKDCMQKAFSVNAYQYIMKPVDEKEFKKIFKKASDEVLKIKSRIVKSEKSFSVGNGAAKHVIKSCDVIYIESIGHKNIVHCDNSQTEYYGNLIDLEKELAPDFFRIHRGYLINLSRVDHYDRKDVYMDNGDTVLVSRYKYHDFVKAYLNHIK